MDSGIIVICDRQDREILSYQESFKVPNGTYDVKWFMPDTYNDNVSGSGILRVTTGEIMVSDPCYFKQFDNHDDWLRFLKKCNCFKKPIPGWVVLDKHGGDGSFTVEIELKRK